VVAFRKKKTNKVGTDIIIAMKMAELVSVRQRSQQSSALVGETSFVFACWNSKRSAMLFFEKDKHAQHHRQQGKSPNLPVVRQRSQQSSALVGETSLPRQYTWVHFQRFSSCPACCSLVAGIIRCPAGNRKIGSREVFREN
jgi:hypothetical protein